MTTFALVNDKAHRGTCSRIRGRDHHRLTAEAATTYTPAGCCHPEKTPEWGKAAAVIADTVRNLTPGAVADLDKPATPPQPRRTSKAAPAKATRATRSNRRDVERLQKQVVVHVAGKPVRVDYLERRRKPGKKALEYGRWRYAGKDVTFEDGKYHGPQGEARTLTDAVAPIVHSSK